MADDQPIDQRNLPFETPTQDEIVAITGMHIEALETSNDDAVWMGAGMTHVLITIVGRKSGVTRKTPVPYWRDPEGHRIVVASFAGAEHHPAWYHNIADRVANPTVTVKERDHVYESVPEVLTGDEYGRIWGLITTDRPFYVDYQAKTQRTIPLIRLPE